MFDYLNHYFGFKQHIVEPNFQRQNDKYCADIFYDFSPILILPNSLDEFRKTHKRKFWYNIKRSKKLISNEIGNFSFRKYYNDDAVNLLLPIRKIFLDKWENDYTTFPWKRDKGYQKFVALIQEIISKNNNNIFDVSVLHLDKDSTILAYSLGFQLNGFYHFFMHNVNINYNKSRYSLGTVLLDYMLRDFIKNPNINSFDFMLGLNNYKLKWTNQKIPIYWRIETKRSIFLLPIHIIKVLFFYVKIKIQKNSYLNKSIKFFFHKLSGLTFLDKIIRIFENKVFKM